MTAGVVPDYLKARTKQDVARGAYLSGYTSLQNLTDQNFAVKSAEQALALEVALLPLAVADVVAIAKVLRRGNQHGPAAARVDDPNASKIQVRGGTNNSINGVYEQVF